MQEFNAIIILKNIILIFLIITIINPVFASSINKAVYKTIQADSYRNNYNRQVNNRVIPYWQAQSNFSTRNRIYRDYANYNNNMYNYTNTRNNYRGYR